MPAMPALPNLTETDPNRIRRAFARLSERERATLARLRRLLVIDLPDDGEVDAPAVPSSTRVRFAA